MFKLDYFLTNGEKTQAGPNVKKLATCIEKTNTQGTVEQILYLMANRIPLIQDPSSNKKFKRSAEEIIKDRNRDGCCDSSTLFVALCREKGIPAVQIITGEIPYFKKENYDYGHFFSGYYIEEKDEWVIIDSNVDKSNFKRAINPCKYDPSHNLINKDFYAFAYVRDYSDFELDGIKIDSIKAMKQIHKKVYEEYIDKEIDLE